MTDTLGIALPANQAATDELTRFQTLFPSVAITPFERREGVVTLDVADSFSAALLSGVAIDPDPPALNPNGLPYSAYNANDCTPGEEQYPAPGIGNFWFKHWLHGHEIGGAHSYDLSDYLAAHGCQLQFASNRTAEQLKRFPDGSRLLRSFGFSYNTWMPAHGYPVGRYDLLPDAATLAEALWNDPTLPLHSLAAAPRLMMDLEHGLLTPDSLQAQPWYTPGCEAAYYAGYVATHVAMVSCARRAGFQNVSIYGWAPMPRSYYNLDTPSIVDWSWELVGQLIYDAVDTVIASVYCFYWRPFNVQYVLANLDYCYAHLATQATRKPIHAYCTTLLQGIAWFTHVPVPVEEYRAVALYSFFSGASGTMQWNYSSRSLVSKAPLAVGAYVSLGGALVITDIATGIPRDMGRYDALLLTDITDGVVTVQVVDRMAQSPYGTGPSAPFYTVLATDLTAVLRTDAEPIAGFTQGLAMARALETHLAVGQLMQDQSRAELLTGMYVAGTPVPVVRRRKVGNTHVLCVFDSAALYGMVAPGRVVSLANFDGVPGLTLEIPTDAEPRVYLLRG